MRSRSRFTRSRYRSSRIGGMRYGYGRSTVPLKGPFAIIFFVGIGLFLVFFFLNFFMAMFYPDFFLTVGTWFFFIPFIVMMIMVGSIFIGSIVTMVKGGGVTNVFSGVSLQTLTSLATKQGYQVTTLAKSDASSAQYLLENQKQKILFKSLGMNEPFTSGMVQALAKGLSQYQANEAWIVQSPATFIENDKNFARFYNVSLLSFEEALAKLASIQGS